MTDDNILHFILENFEIKSQNTIYFTKRNSYINYNELKRIIRFNYGNLNDYELDNYITKLILYCTNDVDVVFEFFSVHSGIEYITYYNTN